MKQRVQKRSETHQTTPATREQLRHAYARVWVMRFVYFAIAVAIALVEPAHAQEPEPNYRPESRNE
jgi:hypothetical protein